LIFAYSFQWAVACYLLTCSLVVILLFIIISSSSNQDTTQDHIGIQDEQRSGVERDSQDIHDEDTLGTSNDEQRSGIKDKKFLKHLKEVN
jgi:hypothetical protein